MVVKVFLVLSCLALTTVTCQTVCGIVGPIWRNNNHTCPTRAICGDVFQHPRDWRNGTACDEVRMLSNCLCPGNTVCPFFNSNFMLRASSIHKQFMCAPACTLPWCDNVLSAPDGRRGQEPVRASMTAEQRAQEFGGKTYYRMECRCSGHVQASPRRQRTVRARGYRYNWNYGRYSTLYICDPRWADQSINDPCDGDDSESRDPLPWQ